MVRVALAGSGSVRDCKDVDPVDHNNEKGRTKEKNGTGFKSDTIRNASLAYLTIYRSWDITVVSSSVSKNPRFFPFSTVPLQPALSCGKYVHILLANLDLWYPYSITGAKWEVLVTTQCCGR
ncbi:hypothetical protein Pelo_10918 [Pelomyxa schiedti]|nr:hypothetical protein Pelo_10918 [Pelomyxa schiedti]